jgi:hypothetical protein
MKPMSARAREMLAEYRRTQALPAELRTRALDALRERVQAGELDANAAPDAAPAPAAGRPRWSRGASWKTPLACIALGGVAVWAALSRPAPSDSQRPALTPARVAEQDAGGGAAAAADAPEPVAPAVAQPLLETAPRAHAADALPSRPRRARISPAPAAASADREAPREPPASPSSGAGHAAVDALGAGEPREPDQTPSEPPSVAAPRQLAVPTSTAPAAQPRTSSIRLPAARLETRRTAAPPATLDAEVMQLRQAYDQLRAGEPQRALSSLSEHARRFPDGKLSPMREVARMLALCTLGKVELARAEARRFLRHHADSTYAARVRNLCDEASMMLPKID